MNRYIWISGRRYYLWDTYNTYQEAMTEGLRHRKRNKTRTFILPIEVGTWFPEKRYALYMNKMIKLW